MNSLRSPYNDLVESSVGRVVSFARKETGRDVYAIDLDNPARQVFPYTAALFAGALICPSPRSVLSLGLGAGSFNRLFEKLFDACLTTVEIDRMVIELAKTRMGFEETENNVVIECDARAFLSGACQTYDWIVSDVFALHSRTPASVATVEFYKLVKSRLAPHGAFVMNVPDFPHWASHVTTLCAAFAQVSLVQVKGGGLIALASSVRSLTIKRAMQKNARQLPDATAFGLDFLALCKSVVDPAVVSLTTAPRSRVFSDAFAY